MQSSSHRMESVMDLYYCLGIGVIVALMFVLIAGCARLKG